jgi:hypothetical protein
MPSTTETKPWWRQKSRWGNFGAAVIFVGVFPLLPLLFEAAFTGELTSDSVMITAALSGLAVALTSRNPTTFALFLAFTIVAAAFYGHAAPTPGDNQQAYGLVAGIRLSAISKGNVELGSVFFWSLAGPFVAALGQRFLRHLRRDDKFFEFG